MIQGRCHLCGERRQIEYCELCKHWFCEVCRKRWFKRGLAAVKQRVRGWRPGCCGPGG